MRRREFIAGLGSAMAWPLAARAQQSGRTYRIALLAPFSVARIGAFSSFSEELKRAGFIEDHNLLINWRGTEIDVARLESVAAELANAAPDAILTWGPAAGRAAQHATRSIPIIHYTDDPLESGLVSSMSKPGGNTTGVGIFAAQLDAKRLELLHEIVPAAKRIGILADPTQIGRAQVEAAARNLNLELITREAHATVDIVPAIDALAAAKVEALNILASAVFAGGHALIIDRARALGLPAIYWWADHAREGGLAGFGPNLGETYRLLAQQLLRVLSGTSPGDLPIVQPTKFELVINLRAAKALSIEIPGSILARADEVIE